MIERSFVDKNATWLGGPYDGMILALPIEAAYIEAAETKMRYPIKPGGPTGYRILYYEGVKSED